ncbi:hypothetical protein MHYP_G00320270 [Metynnis hypsauchen]
MYKAHKEGTRLYMALCFCQSQDNNTGRCTGPSALINMHTQDGIFENKLVQPALVIQRLLQDRKRGSF